MRIPRRIVAWKYALAVIVLLVGSVYVSRQYQKAREQCNKECTPIKSTATPPASHAQDCDECEKNADRRLPYWYRLVAWPKGITTWAILLTLMVIAEQTNQIRRTADISARALVTEFKPKIVVRKMRLNPTAVIYFDRRNDGVWKIDLEISNVGGTPAYVQEITAYFQVYVGHSPTDDLGGLFADQPFEIPAGRRREIAIPLSAEKTRSYMEKLESSIKQNGIRTDWPICHGTITFRDDNGIDRDTGFGREWDIKAERFIPIDSPEWEYQD